MEIIKKCGKFIIEKGGFVVEFSCNNLQIFNKGGRFSLKKTVIGICLGVSVLSLGIAGLSYGKSDFSKKELEIQQSIVTTFDLTNEKLEPISFENIYSEETSKEEPKYRHKIVNAIDALSDENVLNVGDSKPIVFKKGNNVLIGIKHPNNKITLTEFDLSKDKAVKVLQQDKEVK